MMGVSLAGFANVPDVSQSDNDGSKLDKLQSFVSKVIVKVTRQPLIYSQILIMAARGASQLRDTRRLQNAEPQPTAAAATNRHKRSTNLPLLSFI